MLQLKDVKKIYTTKAGEVHALNGVSITFPSTGLVFITGKSGCGKTTLLNVIGGLDGIDDGEIYIQDKRFSTFSAKEYDSYRNTFVGFVFQEYNLLSEFTVEYNIKIAMELQGREMDEEALDKLLKDVGIEDLKNRKPSELSGGQRQRVAIARALVKEPRIIMADEPTGALDGATGIQVLDTLKKLSKDKLIIVVSHDIEFAERYADRIIHLVDGQVVEDITFDEKELEANLSDKESVLIVKEGADLSENEKNVLAKAVKERKKIEFTEKVSFRDKKPTGKVKKDDSEPVALQKSKMKLRSSAYLGVKSLAVKPIRLIITIIVSALAFAVFGLFDTIANFNTQNVLKNHFEKYAKTAVASADYIVDNETNDAYHVKISEEAVAMLESKTKGTVKGIFDFSYRTQGRKDHVQAIDEIKYSNAFVGKSYYTQNINGFIEFDGDTEIDANGNFRDFDYKLVSGRYPKIITDQGEKRKEETTNEIVISNYLAQSIIFFLDGKPLNEKVVVSPEDLRGSKITINTVKYTIVGIVDCGTIPEKYDLISTSNPGNPRITSLVDDFTAYINSGAQKCVFVAKGFKDIHNQAKLMPDLCYTGGSNNTQISIEIEGMQKQLSLDDYVYGSRDYGADNIMLFSGEYPTNGQLTLQDDEVVIHPRNFGMIFEKSISALDAADESQVRTWIIDMENLSTARNRELFAMICDKLGLNISSGYISAKLHQTCFKRELESTRDIKIVGWYYGIETNHYIGSYYKVMMNDNLMQSLGIYPEQGDYSKVLFSSKSIENSSDIIVDYLLKTNGLALDWYNNPALIVVSENQAMIRQAADLFLYVSIALALFSIFMLYNYISTSIANKQRSVGVLRGLGAGGKDILRTFLSESLIIGAINGALAILLSFFGCMFVNWYIMSEMNILVEFALFGIRQILIIAGVSILTAILASALPIIKISKKKPVELIRRA